MSRNQRQGLNSRRHSTQSTHGAEYRSRGRYSILSTSTDDDDSTSESTNNNNNWAASPESDRRRRRQEQAREEIELDELPRLHIPTIAPLPKLTEEEARFFRMVEAGNTDEVREFLASSSFQSMDINKLNRMGYAVLHLAVLEKHEEMVKLLLEQENIRLYDTILHAIRVEDVGITNLLLEFHDSKTRSPIPGSSYEIRIASLFPKSPIITPMSGLRSSISDEPNPMGIARSRRFKPRKDISTVRLSIDDNDSFDSDFNPVVTPLMLAAQVENTKLMEIFYDRGERLETDEFSHNLKCECDICVVFPGEYDMTRAHQRHNLFRSLTSPKYICFIARKEKKDPINYAIDKILKLKVILKKVPVNEKFYEEFIGNMENFIVQMLELCRSTKEVEIFLSPKDSANEENLPHTYPRLWYVVGLRLRKVVAHHNFQCIVEKMWATDDWPSWDTYGFCITLLIIICHLVIGVLTILILFVMPNTDKLSFYRSPLCRCLNYAFSYIAFLILLVCQANYSYNSNSCQNYTGAAVNGNDEGQGQCVQPGPPRVGTEWFIVVYWCGFAVSMKKRWRIPWYLEMKWNWIDIAMMVSLLITFVCWIIAWCVDEFDEKYLPAKREQWLHYCPEILGECFLSVSIILAFVKLLQFTLLIWKLGPIQIGLGKQVVDFMSTALIYVVVLIGFAGGLVGVYGPYEDVMEDKAFTDFFPTLENLFWYLYGHAKWQTIRIPVMEWKDNKTNLTGEVHHVFNEFTGTVLYFVYHVFGSLVVFSMLTGYFAQTLSQLQDSIDMHWKFNRTEMLLLFYKDTLLPPPFNLIPPLPYLWKMIKCYYCGLIGKKDDPKLKCSYKQCCHCYVTEGASREQREDPVKQYRKLIVEVIYRYNAFNDVIDNITVIEDASRVKDERKRKQILEFLGRNSDMLNNNNDHSRHDPGNDGRPDPGNGSGALSGNQTTDSHPNPSQGGVSVASGAQRAQSTSQARSATGTPIARSASMSASPSQVSASVPGSSSNIVSNTQSQNRLVSSSKSSSQKLKSKQASNVTFSQGQGPQQTFEAQAATVTYTGLLVDLSDDRVDNVNNNNHNLNFPFDI